MVLKATDAAVPCRHGTFSFAISLIGFERQFKSQRLALSRNRRLLPLPWAARLFACREDKAQRRSGDVDMKDGATSAQFLGMHAGRLYALVKCGARCNVAFRNKRLFEIDLQ